mgnify:CR=1 FL=1|tara:strand:- start:1985 stop:3334 length:1350 start_codon:yes stop_codon:yes gene_type:complete
MATKAGGGGGGSSAYNSDVCTLESGSSSATGVDPYIEVEYTSASATGQTVTTTTTVTGAQEKKLSLRRDTVGIHTVQCKISHPTAVNNPASVANSPGSTRDNSPLWTDKVEFNALSAVNLTRSNLTYEITQDNARSSYSNETVNLFVQPLALTGWSASNNSYRNIHIFAKEEDLSVKMTMSGSAGQDHGENDSTTTKGGQGGLSIFTYTLLRNVEYTLKLGVTIEPTASIGRGGAGAYFYEGGRLLVACGGGGASGLTNGSNGGRGAGAGIAGERGGGASGGAGGQKVNTGELPASGILPNGHIGGKVESCTSGQYWKDQGIAPCEFMGIDEFVLFNGIRNTATDSNIKRGYKADYDKFGYRHNGGNSSVICRGGNCKDQFICGGGAGAYGGNASLHGSDGGGGGSGYSNGSVNMLHSQLGGNPNSQAQCLIELLTSDNDKVVDQIIGS